MVETKVAQEKGFSEQAFAEFMQDYF